MGENEFKDLWLRRYFVQTRCPVPALQRRVDVIKETVLEYTPLEVAIMNLDKKNQEIIEEISIVSAAAKKDVQRLSMLLQGVLDAAVMGGIAKYQEAFFDGSYMAEFPDQEVLRPKFQKVLADQIPILKDGLDLYTEHSAETLKLHVEHLTTSYEKMVVNLKETVLSDYQGF